MTRPVQVTAWMLGHYQARVDDCKLLSDIPLWNLDPRYVAELESRAFTEVAKIEGYDTPYRALREAYTEIGELKETIIELRKTLRRANERI